ncbi:calcium-transporting ATPase [Cymbomonas tetramitiformis]|uniref:P-type Ca(2+) transporter n=1 Tax=Cymbomonas tetramitiformis TaxID=36881 RepID=A0AAE0F378_9CHLO|nr:calcium-transporting ATPase [Cymbomonas tetramitiformis]
MDGPFPAWAKSGDEVLKHHKTDFQNGLSTAQVEDKLARFGPNELAKEEGTPLWKLVLAQFDDSLVKILLLAAAVSFGLTWIEEAEKGAGEGEGIRAYIEPAVILLILVLNAIVGVWQESNAERALEALKEMQSETAKTWRDGKLIGDLPATELVPGDIIELSEGDKVPADIRVLGLKSLVLQLDQALLTGESVEVNKQVDPIDDEDVAINGKLNMLFSGTAVKKGQCVGIVNTTGMNTEIGEIHEAIQKAGEEDDDTPLKKKLDEFGELLTKVIGVICLTVWLINYNQFLSWEMKDGMPTNFDFKFKQCTYYFKIAVALAVAAIPEGLPAVITTCLALGTRKMAQKGAIVRKLPSVETLGCTTVICSDKTGTLTTNQMSVTSIVVPASAETIRNIEVQGSTYNPRMGGVSGVTGPLDASLLAFTEVATLCNQSVVDSDEKEEVFKAIGQPTEAALMVAADKLVYLHGGDDAYKSASRQWISKYTTQAVLEFDRDRKRMSVICSPVGGTASGRPATRSSTKLANNNVLVCKGQAASVISQCTSMLLQDGSVVPLSPTAKEAFLAEVEKMSAQALRCLALAKKSGPALGDLSHYDGPGHPAHDVLLDNKNYNSVEDDLTFVGIAGLMDPPRPEVKPAILNCRAAGMRVIMITGDYRATAEAIAKSIGIFAEGEDISSKSFTGKEFVSLSPEEQINVLAGKGGVVFSGAQPTHKQAIVARLKDRKEIVAMTGDGVNDAPALKLADIGVAMGIAGTEVAKEASDMVLADDNFSTIVDAVAEGRSIYNNMKAFIRYMISSNIGEVASIFLTAALGMPEGLIPVQLLWVNLVTDGPPATALGFNPPDPDIMAFPPRRHDDPLITGWVFFRYMIVGLYVGFATVGGFAIWYTSDSFLGIDLSQDGHSVITWHQLTHWNECASWEGVTVSPWSDSQGVVFTPKDACDYFSLDGKAKASTLSLSILVAIEMFNALNALSEDNSLLQVPPWCNPYLLIAMVVSFGLHFVILYIPAFASTFSIVPLNLEEWKLVILLAAPVMFIDEILKFFGRMRTTAARAQQKKEL